ncbi:MAG: hypothetical protein F6J87_28385 [Spirulina sp. SIO3F2]|nr:hypothetical protein [Spirulina sp. SIO3F2]
MTTDLRLLERWRSQLQVQGEVSLPSLPSCLPNTLDLVEQLVNQFGQPLKTEEKEELQTGIEKLIAESFATGPYARLTVIFHSNPPPKTGITCDLTTTVDTVPLPELGEEPDAKVLELAAQWEAEHLMLALGVGNGRNIFPLMEQGYTVEAWEWRLPLALRKTQSLPLENPLAAADLSLETEYLLDPLARLDPAKYHFIFAPDLVGAIGQTPEQLRLLLAKLCDGLVSGGQILLGLWLSEQSISPSVQEWLQWQGHWVLTRKEIEQLQTKLPLRLCSCESAFDYEQSKRGDLPPIYADWLRGEGLNLSETEQNAIALHWLVWERL